MKTISGDIIRTTGDLIDALGGTAATSRLCGVTMQAVSNWRAEGFIPERHHLVIYRTCQAREIAVEDSVFERPAA